MSGLFIFIWFVSLIAFIVFWRKKANAKKAAGSSYESDEKYLSVSKTKRIIGIVSAVSFVLGIAFSGGSGEAPKKTETKPAATENKPKSEENFLGNWYSLKKDSSGIVTAITFLNIKDEKSAQIDSYELTNAKLAEGQPNKLLWRSSSLNVEMKRSGKNFKFIVKVPDGDDVEVLECKYDSDSQKLTSKESTFTKEPVDIQKTKEENIQQYKNNLEKQGEKIEIVQDMNESEYKDYVNKQIFGLP